MPSFSRCPNFGVDGSVAAVEGVLGTLTTERSEASLSLSSPSGPGATVEAPSWPSPAVSLPASRSTSQRRASPASEAPRVRLCQRHGRGAEAPGSVAEVEEKLLGVGRHLAWTSLLAVLDGLPPGW